MRFNRGICLRIALGASLASLAAQLPAQEPGARPVPYECLIGPGGPNPRIDRCPPNVGDTPQIGPFELSNVYGPGGSYYRTPRVGVPWFTATSRSWYFGRHGYTPPMYGYSVGRNFQAAQMGAYPGYSRIYGNPPPGTWFNCD
ncbi:MAG TPA: hypothetical protein VHB77_21430 [Planctomycetaceae bacterium]|nr:hypothetical protein [Planctomycetaceae bacterium]